MSTAPPTSSAVARPPMAMDNEILIISHSNLFYWWPVWAVGFLLALLTLLDGQRMVLVDKGAEAVTAAEIRGKDGKTYTNRSAWVLSDKENIRSDDKVRVSRSKNYGVLFVVVLLLVIAITNIPLRGLWSVIVIVFIISLSIIFALLNWWEDYILPFLGNLDVRINLEGYFLIASVLLLLWFLIFAFFDRQIYMIFTPGQLRVRLEIGDAETAYDAAGMTIQKQRSDLFRHWVLGLGSGDLIVRTTGAQSHQFDMPNVLFLGRKVREIEDLLRAKQVVSGENPSH